MLDTIKVRQWNCLYRECIVKPARSLCTDTPNPLCSSYCTDIPHAHPMLLHAAQVPRNFAMIKGKLPPAQYKDQSFGE